MYVRLKRFLTLLMVTIMTMSAGHAQKKAIGTCYSFSGIGIMYEHRLTEDCFITADLRTELGEVFMERTDVPGISASVIANFIISSWKSSNGNDLYFYAGPGMAIGSANDFHSDHGYFFGLKGRIGVECLFTSRNISISASLCPILGSHMSISDESIIMSQYVNGIINTILPEIGVKYIF